MSKLGEALRKKYRTPQEALRQLGLDEKLANDSRENVMAKPTRFAAAVLMVTAAGVAPILAMDSKLTLPKDLFAGITSANFKDKKAGLLAGVRKELDGKLRKGLAMDDAMSGVVKLLEAVGAGGGATADAEVDESGASAMEAASIVDPNAAQPPADYAKDAEPLKAFLKEKGFGDEDIKRACDLMPKALANATDESPEEKEAREKKEADEKAAKENAMKDMVTKPAMDAAITAAVTTARKTEQGIRAAIVEVRPWVGDFPATMAFDSADDVYRKAATALKIDGADTIHASALPSLIRLQPKPGAHPSAGVRHDLAMDAAGEKSFAERFPGADRIATV